MYTFHRMILIGSTNRNAGKTTLALHLVGALKERLPVYGLKVTSHASLDEPCHRGHLGCGACSAINKDFILCEEFPSDSQKDTALMLKAGARRSFWLRTLHAFVLEGFQAFAAELPSDALVICESNTLRNALKPGLFVMMKNPKAAIKPTAQAVMGMADIVYENDLKMPLTALAEEISKRF